MTHAALKDLVKKWRGEAGRERMLRSRAAFAQCADELSAALSAMEGEAVAEVGPVFSLVWRGNESIASICAKHPEIRIGTKLYTAPPPQQAVGDATEAELRAVRRARDFAERTAASEEEGDAYAHGWFEGEQYAKEQPTHPTPSPGPQGGGEADPALVEFSRWFANNYPGPDTIISDPSWHAPRIFRSVEYMLRTLRATPPAHQPGEAVTDEMVEAAADAFAGEGVHDCSSDMLRRVIRAALTAALSTTAASGGEHG